MSSPTIIHRLTHPSKSQKILIVIGIATLFLFLEIAVGFVTRSLALVADAFHVLSDVIGYVVALVATKYSKRSKVSSLQYTYGYRKAEVLGAFFNGAFLMALGVSVLLQSIERFIEPTHVTDPVLVMAIGAAGIGSNVLMLLVLGGHSHGDEAKKTDSQEDGSASNTALDHDGHAHARADEAAPKKSRFTDLNILGILIHILGDALNSIAVIISAGIYKATGFVYADPIASVFVGAMIIGTAWPLLLRSGRSLLDAAPDAIDIKGVREDIERVSGEGTVHDLHVWSVDAKNAIASLHLLYQHDSLQGFDAVTEDIRKCLHLWGIHNVTIQPEMSFADPTTFTSTSTTRPTPGFRGLEVDVSSPGNTDIEPDPAVVFGGVNPRTTSSSSTSTRAKAQRAGTGKAVPNSSSGQTCKKQCMDSCQAPVGL